MKKHTNKRRFGPRQVPRTIQNRRLESQLNDLRERAEAIGAYLDACLSRAKKVQDRREDLEWALAAVRKSSGCQGLQSQIESWEAELLGLVQAQVARFKKSFSLASEVREESLALYAEALEEYGERFTVNEESLALNLAQARERLTQLRLSLSHLQVEAARG